MAQNKSNYPITVIDCGARYGIHLSFNGWNTTLRYIAFEPDPIEDARLAKKYESNSNYSVYPLAMGDKDDEVTLRILRHHGQSTLLEPNHDSAWFATTRTSDGHVEREVQVGMTTLDNWCQLKNISPDFLKIDTEGFDYFVIKGAHVQLSSSLLAVRCEVLFHKVFHGARLFGDILEALRDHNFILANIAYDGKGAHQSFFCPGDRYGLLTGCESVFVKNPNSLTEMGFLALVKYCIFCLKNDIPDLAFKVIDKNPSLWAEACHKIKHDPIFQYLDYLYQHAVNKLKYMPGPSFAMGVESYSRFFGNEYLDLHNFYESTHLNP